jgi:Mg-chelatase subunit ChlD
MRAFIAAALIIAASAQMSFATSPPAETQEQAAVDIVFCIDCSGSMGGVIEAAKQKVWAIVNEVAKAKPTPVLRIGLLGYGQADQDFRTTELTSDLDEVYRNLMAFDANFGGDEWVGLMIHKAANEMKWSEADQVLKVIYVVGNETAQQGTIDYRTSAPNAIAKGIMINAIYCGNEDAEVRSTWQEVARLADGQYLEIAETGGVVLVATPFDDELAELSQKLNETYVGYGVRRELGLATQTAQDANAATLGGGVAAERAVAKSSSLYSNASWDLVDASARADFELDKLEEKELPEELQKMSAEQRKAHIDQKAQQRQQVQAQIQELATRRDAFVREEMAKQGLDTDQAFDNVVRSSLRQQAEKKGFTFE